MLKVRNKQTGTVHTVGDGGSMSQATWDALKYTTQEKKVDHPLLGKQEVSDPIWEILEGGDATPVPDIPKDEAATKLKIVDMPKKAAPPKGKK